MTALTAQNTSTNSLNYTIQQSDSLNSPIAEAGYTVTPLQRTSSTTSRGVVVQQESFLFIGGHTQTAFLNMSTLALFSLPQASWSYISVGATVDTGRTDLAIRDTTEIEPRSGHSAVMSSDGSKIIVYGGWVGDTSTPADPQLAILEVGEDYGGSGGWTWSIPVSSLQRYLRAHTGVWACIGIWNFWACNNDARWRCDADFGGVCDTGVVRHDEESFLGRI